MATIGSAVARLRKQKNLTQVAMAKALAMSRPSYIAIEKGLRDVSIQEAERLSQILGVTVEELVAGITPRYDVYRDMILVTLQASARKGDGKVPKTKLAKLLYLADFAWFYEHLDSMSGLGYRKIQFGPVPDTFFRMIDELEENGLVTVEHKKGNNGPAYLINLTRAGSQADGKFVTDEQKNLINTIEEKWHNSTTNEIVAFTHGQLPYKLASDGELISYALIGQEDHDNVF